MKDHSLTSVRTLVAKATTVAQDLQNSGQWNQVTRSGSTFQTRTHPPAPASHSPAASPSGPYTHDRAGRPIDRVPPTAGQAHSRVNANNGRTEQWCPTCSRWGSHDESGHGPWKEQQMRHRNRGRSQANNTIPTPAPAPGPTTSTPAPGPLTMPRPSVGF
jgi:hypothetical protein